MTELKTKAAETAEAAMGEILPPEKEEIVAVLAAKQKANDELDPESQAIITELTRIAYGDIRDLLDGEGNLKPPSEWPEAAAKAVAAIDVEEIFDGHGKGRSHVGTLRKIKLWDKGKALEMLGRHKALFHDRLDVNIVTDLAERLEAMRLRRVQYQRQNEASEEI